MGIQTNPYSLRLETVTMAKLKVVAKINVRSVNKEIEMIAQQHIADYEKKNGPIVVENQ